MPKMNPMDVVVKILEDEGVDYVFGVPGAAILPLYKALSTSERIKNISVRHEEGGTQQMEGSRVSTHHHIAVMPVTD
jgi:tartronate-semialdehyde synthase